MKRRWPSSDNLACIMKDTGREMQENMLVDTSLTIKQFPDVIDPKGHAQKERNNQASSKFLSRVRLPGAQACKASEEGGLELLEHR
jgi:hypothetical protein